MLDVCGSPLPFFLLHLSKGLYSQLLPVFDFQLDNLTLHATRSGLMPISQICTTLPAVDIIASLLFYAERIVTSGWIHIRYTFDRNRTRPFFFFDLLRNSRFLKFISNQMMGMAGDRILYIFHLNLFSPESRCGRRALQPTAQYIDDSLWCVYLSLANKFGLHFPSGALSLDMGLVFTQNGPSIISL